MQNKPNPLNPGPPEKQRHPWFEKNPALLADVKQALQEFNWLHLHLEDGIARIKGTLCVPGDRFTIEITFPNDYPHTLPQVRETAGRIPYTADRHVNPHDGTSCLCIPDEWFFQRSDKKFITFLKGPVSNYFLSQKYFEVYGEWPLGERQHFNDGLLDFYEELLGTRDPQVIKRYLEYLSRDKIKGHWDCPCGSGKRIRNCHRETLADLKNKIPPNIAFSSLRRLQIIS